jgi:DnaJ-class molecular chaperone
VNKGSVETGDRGPTQECPTCKGTGHVGKKPCPTCNAMGRVLNDPTVTNKSPNG